MTASILWIIALGAATLATAEDAARNHTQEEINKHEQRVKEAEELKHNIDKAHAQLKDAVSLLERNHGEVLTLSKNHTKVAALADHVITSSHKAVEDQVTPLQKDLDAQLAHLHKILKRDATKADQRALEKEIAEVSEKAFKDSGKLKVLSRKAHRDAYEKLKSSEQMKRGNARAMLKTAKNAARNMLRLRNHLAKAQRRARMGERVYEKDSLHYELAAEHLREHAQDQMGEIEDSLGSIFDTARDRVEEHVETETRALEARNDDVRRAVTDAREFARHGGEAQDSGRHDSSQNQHHAKKDAQDNQKMSSIQQELNQLKQGLHNPIGNGTPLVQLVAVPELSSYVAVAAAGVAAVVAAAALVHVYTRPRMITPPLLG